MSLLLSDCEMLKEKKGIIFGITNHRSIGWGIIKAAHAYGANLAIVCQNERLKNKILPIVEPLGIDLIYECDVTNEGEVDELYNSLKTKWSNIDFIVHSVAFSNKDELSGSYLKTSRDNFLNSMNISCYSFTYLVKKFSNIISDGGSALTLTYYGSEKVMPHYNVMGVCKAALESSVRYLASALGRKNIRVNAISAGPIKTLASAAIGNFSYIEKWYEENSPLNRGVSIEDVGNSASFLLSDLARSITGEILYVDCGYHSVGMKMSDWYESIKDEEIN